MELSFEDGAKYGAGIAGLVAGVFGYLKSKRKKNQCDSCELCKHRLFKILENYRFTSQQPGWQCINEYKTRVGRKVIQIKLEIGIRMIKEFICRAKNIENSGDLKIEFEQFIVSMINTYEAEWLRVGINPIIINRLSKYHNSNARYAIRLFINELDKDYQSVEDKLTHGLDSLIIPYSMFMLDVRNVLDAANGDLAGDMFEGVTNDGRHVSMNLDLLRTSFSE